MLVNSSHGERHVWHGKPVSVLLLQEKFGGAYEELNGKSILLFYLTVHSIEELLNHLVNQVSIKIHMLVP